jgi:cold shock CspA family protein
MKQQRQTGVVERWYPAKRYGFIKPAGAFKATVFFHESELGGEWDVSEGLTVTYHVETSPKGVRAMRVEAA